MVPDSHTGVEENLSQRATLLSTCTALSRQCILHLFIIRECSVCPSFLFFRTSVDVKLKFIFACLNSPTQHSTIHLLPGKVEASLVQPKMLWFSQRWEEEVETSLVFDVFDLEFAMSEQLEFATSVDRLQSILKKVQRN